MSMDWLFQERDDLLRERDEARTEAERLREYGRDALANRDEVRAELAEAREALQRVKQLCDAALSGPVRSGAGSLNNPQREGASND